MTMPGVALIGVPSSAGARRTGQEGAPAAFRAAGFLERLRAKGLDVADLGDLPPVSFRPDPGHPRQQNFALVVNVARQAADSVDRAQATRRWPLVLGGDCSLSLGVIAGLLRHHSHLGLLYFDGDVDLNTPETTQSGVLDGMVMAHVLGRGAPELAGIGPRRPLLSEEDIVLFGYDVDSGWLDPPELEALERSRMSKFPQARVRVDAAAVARDALLRLETRSDMFLVHFDVDVMDCPAADVPHPHGLDTESAFAALRVFVTAPTCAALVVTELNAERDADGSHTARLVHAGAAYLLYLGAVALLRLPPLLGVRSTTDGPGAGRRTLLFRGFVLQLSNPNSLLFFVAILPQFIDRSRPVVLQILVLGVTSIVLEFVVLAAYGSAAAVSARVTMQRRFATATSRLSGALLVGAALYMLKLKG